MRTLVVLALVLSVGVTASPAAAARVAVLMSSKVNEYEEALKGFKEATSHQIVAVYDMDGDPERGRKYLAEIEAKVKPDLIFAVGIWALQVVASRPSSIPVVYAMVLNPPSVLGADAKNVTGASMNVPVEQSVPPVQAARAARQAHRRDLQQRPDRLPGEARAGGRA